MRRWVSTGVAGVALTVLVLAAALPAAARTTKAVTVELVGSLTISWQGDPARGCAAEGLCGVSGSLQMIPSGGSASSGPPQLELSDPTAAARVTEGTGATLTTCADPVPVDFNFVVRGDSAVIDVPGSSQLPSSGRCAGPTAADLDALALPVRKLGSHGYDFSGETTFGAGPFTVTATSTVRALFNPPASAGPLGLFSLTTTGSIESGSIVGSTTGRPARHRALKENAQLVYRIEGYSGALTTSFAGLAPPLCEPVGACGTTGNLSQTFTSTGTIAFSGSRIVKHRVSASAALRDLRAGRLGVYDSFGEAPINALVSETLTGPGTSTCNDQAESSVSGNQTPARGHELGFVLGGNLFAGILSGTGDPLRTHCPGPSRADVFGTAPLASARLATSALGAHTLTITFHSAGSFAAGAYGGERDGSLVLTLVLVRVSGGTSHVTLGSGIPPGFGIPPSLLP